jgi:hypothetical protein
MNEKEWELPNIPNENIAVEDAQFIFNQAAKRLEGTITNTDLITSKSITLLTIFASILSAVLVYPLSHWEGVNKMDNKQITAALAALYCIIAGACLIKNILPFSFLFMGSKPLDLCLAAFFVEKDKDKRIIDLYLSEIQDYNKRIEHNWSVNDERLGRYRFTLIALYLMPCILAILFLCLEAGK